MLTPMFCDIDDFCKHFEPIYHKYLIDKGHTNRRKPKIALSEMMTIVVYFHQARFRDFKTYYNMLIRGLLRRYFPSAPSYNRFVELMPRTLLPLCVYLRHKQGKCTGIAFIDSTSLVVSHNRRIHQHKVFQGVAARGKTSVGWFFGFKLHLIVNDQGELLSMQLTPGNCDDRVPVKDLCRDLVGKLVADKGYLSKSLAEELLGQNVELITKIRKNMKNKLMLMFDKLLLRKRALIECVFDHLKNICQIEHSRHRSQAGFMVNLLAGLVAYTFAPKKPSLRREFKNVLPMIVV